MGYKLNEKLAELIPYEPISGDYKIRLDANESCYNLSDEIAEKIADEMKRIDYNRYPDPYARNVVKAFADFYEIDETLVTAGNGSDELISIISSCFLEKGDTVVTLAPDFTMYAFYSSLYELNVEIFNKSDDLTVDVDALTEFCKAKNAKALIFSNPCNPTSLGISKKEVKKLIESLDCLVILDEAYMDFWAESLLSDIQKYDNCIILKTCSKAVGLAAIRLGFAVAGKTITTALKAAKSPYNTDSISQMIGEVTFKQRDYLNNKRAEIVNNTQSLYKEMLNLQEEFSLFEKVYETKTNFIFIETSYEDKIFDELLKNSIAIRKFKGFLRISSGSVDENKKLIFAMKNILADIKTGG